MSAAPSLRPRTTAEVQAAGIRALVRELGAADAARFLQQYGPGLGDYTAEREALIGDMGPDDVVALAKEHDAARGHALESNE